MAGYPRKLLSLELALKNIIKELKKDEIKEITGKSESHFRKCTDEQDLDHICEILMLNNTDFNLPANQITTIEKTLSFNQIKAANDLPNNIENIYLFQLFSHAHQLMTRFDVEFYDGETEETQIIYTALDYEHPPILTLNEHLQIQDGDYIKISATYNNITDDDVGFGLLSTDEMMILFGYLYYD